MGFQESGEKNPNWKGDEAGVDALHAWVRRRLPKPRACPRCGADHKLELASLNHTYRRDLSEWEWMCRSCHSTLDGKVSNIEGNKKPKFCVECGDPITWHGSAKYCKPCRIRTRREWWKEFNKTRVR